MKKLKASGLKGRKYRARLARAHSELDALQPLLAVAAFEHATIQRERDESEREREIETERPERESAKVR